MKPETMTLGPSAFSYMCELVKILPEIKEIAYSDLRTVVSTAAPFDKDTAKKMKQIYGLYLHNAMGTSETQQVLTTLLCEKDELEEENIKLGKPIAGVEIGLKKFRNDMYKLYVNSPFGCKNIIGEKNKSDDNFFYTGDIVKLGKNYSIIYVCRENKDFFKSGYGAKVPISFVKNYYKELYEKTSYIEFFPIDTFNLSFGLGALIFVDEKNILKGRIKDEKIIKKYQNLIEKINNNLKNEIEPFEYEQRSISRFILINVEAPKTFKGTFSKYQIEKQYTDEIYDLKYSNDLKSGVVSLKGFRNVYLDFLLRYSPLRSQKVRKVFLRLILWHNKKKQFES